MKARSAKQETTTTVVSKEEPKGFFAKRKAQKKADAKRDTSFQSYPYLLEIKPREKYIFHSDWFEIDGKAACIMDFFHQTGATDNFGAFWGVNRIPVGLPDDVTIVSFEHISKMTDNWVEANQARAERITDMNSDEAGRAGTNSTRGASIRASEDLMVIAREIQDGAAYLWVKYRILVKAPNLKVLDESIRKIDRCYIDRFGTISAAPYPGEQNRELSHLFRKNEQKKGRGYYFTSTELAGSYSLATHGLEDKQGEYVGYMIGDINNSAVLFAADLYHHHVVVSGDLQERHTRIWQTDRWASKISQTALLHGHKVVHLILDELNLDMVGPPLQKLTYKIDMSHGDVNMFEMFGEKEDELSIFPSQMQKLVLIAEQAYETTPQDRSIIRGSLEEIATKYYVDQKMWFENAGMHRDRLRVVGIPHEQVPKLEMFVSYLDMEYKKEAAKAAKDPELLHALGVLRVTFKNLLSNNGDLFNTITTNRIDGAETGRRVIYDFAGLIPRGNGIAMAQLVNIIAYAIGNLGEDDVVIFHGADQIDEGVKEYINVQLSQLYRKGGRAVFCYNDTQKMIKDKEFSHFDMADYTILGFMSKTCVQDYQKALGQEIPADLSGLITQKNDKTTYIRRGYDNIVFREDLRLGLEMPIWLKRYGKKPPRQQSRRGQGPKGGGMRQRVQSGVRRIMGRGTK